MDRKSLQALQQGRSISELSLRVTYYARVSTDKDEQRNSLSNQVAHYEEYIRENLRWTFVPGYVDEGLSGTSVTRRESFLRMVDDARQGLFDLILTKEISRFSRNTLDSIRYTQELLACGVGVFFQSDSINTLMPDAELRLTIMASLAQDEVRRLSERLKFGYRRAVASGRVLGQDNMWGYDKKDGRLTVCEPEAEVVRRVFELYAEGCLGLRAVARALEQEGITDRKGKMFSYGTLHHMLRNPKYKGWYAGHKTESPDYRKRSKQRLPEQEWVTHPDKNIPALVSEALWDAANALLTSRGETMKTHGKACQARYPYSGKILCAVHGTSFHRHLHRSKAGEKEVWNCKVYREKGRAACASPSLYTGEINALLSEALDRVRLDREKILAELVETYAQELSAAENRADPALPKTGTQQEVLARKKEALLELYAGGHISGEEFRRRNDGYSDELEVLARRREQLEREAASAANARQSLASIRSALEAALSRPYDDSLLGVALDSLTVHPLREGDVIPVDVCLRFGPPFSLNLDKKSCGISLAQIGISQAQVSRLEKNAISQMKKYL